MSQFRLLDFNYCFDAATTFLPTSEDPSFPADNLAKALRAKVWRSYGYFVITADNQKLDFKNFPGGPELTATIPPGNYSVADLETMIAARMEIVGGAAYAVTHSRSTGKWSIASSFADLELLTQSGTNAADSIFATLGFDVASDYTGSDEYTGTFVAIHTVERMVIDLGYPCQIDSFAMVFDPDTGHKLSNAASFRLMASNSNNWAAPAVDVALSFDPTYGVITHFFSSVQTKRYWAIEVTDPQNPYLYVEIPKVLLALATQLGQVPQIGFVEGLLDQSEKVENAYGNAYLDVYPNRRTLRFNYAVMSAEDIETLETIEKRLGGVVPFGIALDPLATTFDKDRFFLYGRLKASAEISNLAYTYFNTEISMEEAL